MTWHPGETESRVTCDAPLCPAFVAHPTRPAANGCGPVNACLDASHAALRAGWRVPFDPDSPDLCPSHADAQLPLPHAPKGPLAS